MPLLTPDSKRYLPLALISESRLKTISLLRDTNAQKLLVGHRLTMLGGITDAEAQSRLQAQADLLAGVQHPHLPRFVAYQFTPTGHWLLFEHVPGYALAGFEGGVQALPDVWVMWWLQQMLQVLSTLHPHHVIGGFAPKHLLVEGTGLYMVQVGILENLFPETLALMRPKERLAFTAPEHRNSVKTSVAGDLYSAAAVTFWLACGEPPSSDDPAARMLAARASLPAEFCQAVARLLRFYPKDRFPSAEAALQALAPVVPPMPADAEPPPAPEQLKMFGDTTVHRHTEEAAKVERSAQPRPVPPSPAPLPVVEPSPPVEEPSRANLYIAAGSGVMVLAILVALFRPRPAPAPLVPPGAIRVYSGRIMSRTPGESRWKAVQFITPPCEVTAVTAAALYNGEDRIEITPGSVLTLDAAHSGDLALHLESGGARLRLQDDSAHIATPYGTVTLSPHTLATIAPQGKTAETVTCENGTAEINGTRIVSPGQSATLP